MSGSATLDAVTTADTTPRRPPIGAGLWSGADWSDPKALAQWWFAPLVSARMWTAMGYLLVGVFSTLAWFVATVVVFSVSGPLVIIWLGLPLMWLALGLVDAMVGVERRRAGWVAGVVLPRRFLDVSSGRGWLMLRLADGARWRQVLYLLAAPFLALVALVMPWSIWTPAIDGAFSMLDRGGLFSILETVTGVVVLGLAARLTIMAADAHTRVVEWFVGPDPVDAMAERVEELSAQRREILDAVAGERRRIERNLHDGAQQRLVALGIDLGMAESKISEDPEAARALLADARDKARTSLGELRMIGRGLHPAILEDRGLDAALSAVVAYAPIPISLEVPVGLRFPVEVEETAYYAVSEAVGNVLRHSRARAASVTVFSDGETLLVSVYDDGRGGADPSKGTGLAGISARIRSVDGTLEVSSPPGGPTTLTATIPCRSDRG